VKATALQDYLVAHGLTQEAFAALAKVPAPMVSMWASGKRLPGLAHAAAIEDATGGEISHRYWIGLGAGRRTPKLRRPPPRRKPAANHPRN
jgi:transcriptional regulator with XRE-family HTH domain